MKTRAELVALIQAARAEGDTEAMRKWTAELEALEAVERAQAQIEADAKKSANVVDITPDRAKAIADEAATAENQRSTSIRELATMVPGISSELVEQYAGDRSKSLQDAHKAFYADFAKRNPAGRQAPRIEGGEDNDASTRNQAIIAGLHAKGCNIPLDTGRNERTGVYKPHDRAREFINWRPSDLLRHVLEKNGVRGILHMTNTELIGAVRGNRTASADLSVLLAGTLNASLRGGWNLAPTVWRRIALVLSGNDLRAQKLVKASGLGLMHQVGDGAIIPLDKFADGKYESVTITTFAKNVGVNDDVWINDNLGAITRLPQSLGVSCDMTAEHLLFYQLTQGVNNVGPTMTEDGYKLFTTSARTNLVTSGGAPSDSTIDALSTLMALQTVPANQADAAAMTLGLVPKFIIVPPQLKTTARKVVQSQVLVGANNATMNPWLNELEVISAPTLATGASVYLAGAQVATSTAVTAGWYLATDPNVHAHLVMMFLDGIQTPTFTSDRPIDELATVYQTVLRMGAGVEDPRGLAFNDGA